MSFQNTACFIRKAAGYLTKLFLDSTSDSTQYASTTKTTTHGPHILYRL